MSFAWNPNAYGAAASLLADAPLNELGPGSPMHERRSALEAITLESLFEGKPVRDEDKARCCVSGLWLLYDFLDESHTISQSIPGADGSYWHGIMHRREPDYSNAKYWFRRVGRHEAFEPLLMETASLLKTETPPADLDRLVRHGEWDAFHFVDVCQNHCGVGGEGERLCREIQQLEWRVLFDYCYHHAVE